MKPSITLAFVAILAIGTYTFLSSSSNGRAAAANEGNTGAPGDAATTCISCHNGGPIQTDIALAFKDSAGNTITEYKPNHNYLVEVTLNPTAGSPSGYGFQMVALEDGGNTAISAWNNPASNVKISAANGKRYAEHNGVSSSPTFEIYWTAPDSGTGNVTFYTAGNAVNGNGTTLGDGAAKTSLTVPEAGGSGNPTGMELIALTKPVIFPNPARERVSVKNFSGSIEVFDIQGKLVFSENVESNQQNINVSNLQKGNYFIKLTNEGNSSVQKLVKL